MFLMFQVRLERAGAATFTLLLELTNKSSWRLHMDVEHSVDRLLAGTHTQQLQPPGNCSSSSSGSRGQHVIQPFTQLRRSVVRDDERQLLVRFESSAAAHGQLTWAAQLEATSAAAVIAGDDGSAAALMVPATDAGRGGNGVGWLDQEDARNNTSKAQQQQQTPCRFAGDWLVDLLHVTLHCAVAAGSRATQGG